MKEGRGHLRMTQIEDNVILETFLTAESFSVYFNVPNMLFHFMFIALLRFVLC